MILTKELTKVFRTRRQKGFFSRGWEEKVAVAGLNLEIPRGRITGLLGLNGAGKTTTIKMLSTLLSPTSGMATVDGMDLVREADRIRTQINVIAGGERGVYWRLTGRENLWYFGQLYDIDPKRLNKRITELLELVGLTEAADKLVEKYSKGMKQRLQIARGLINSPGYLFMDEPTIGLDAPIARQLRGMTRDLARQKECGILLTSHYMFEVEELCEYLYVLDRGRVVAQGTPGAIKATTVRERTSRVVVAGVGAAPAVLVGQLEAVLPAGARVEGGPDERGVSITLRADEDLTGLLVGTLTQLGHYILRAESVEPSLEDAILALAQRQEVR